MLLQSGTLTYGDHLVDVRIACKHTLGAGKYQHVYPGLWPRKTHRTDHWRSQQHITDPSCNDDQDACWAFDLSGALHCLSVCNSNVFRKYMVEQVPVSYTHLTLPTNR